jgi:branched-chain amino acid transport system substrate-binding protein
MRRRAGVTTVLLLALGLLSVAVAPPGCDRDSGSGTKGGSKAGATGGGTTTGDIVIGHFASMTGDTATFGVSADEGIQLALKEINNGGGVLGRKIRVITEDDRSLPDEAKTAVQKLINRDKVVALLGEIASSRSIAGAPIAQESEIPMLSPGSTNPKVTEIGDYIFRACFIDPFQGTAMANFALKDLGCKRFATLYAVNSDYSVGLRDFFRDAVTKGGGQIVADLSYTEKNDVDFKSQLTKIRDAKPDAIWVPGYYTEAGLICQQARELGINVPIMGGDGWDSDQTVQIGKEAVNGTYFSNHYHADDDRPEVRRFVETYKAAYKNADGSPKIPDAMAILGYDAMRLMADAIKRAGSTEGRKIRDALAATKDFPGASGTITIDENRNAKKPIVILKIEGGKFKYVSRVNP